MSVIYHQNRRQLSYNRFGVNVPSTFNSAELSFVFGQLPFNSDRRGASSGHINV